MAKKKTTQKGGLFGFLRKKKKPGRRTAKKGPTLSAGIKVTAAIMAVSILIAGGAIGLIYMDRHVRRTAVETTPSVSLKLIEPPAWLEQAWIDTLVDTAGGKRFAPNDAAASVVKQRLAALSWLTNIRVQTTPAYITVKADYRKPIGLVAPDRHRRYYLADDMTVLAYLPIDSIPVIPIEGIASVRSIPEPGLPWRVEDAAAAVQLLDLLTKMDRHFQQERQLEKPLLDEIDSIDVSNFGARKSSSKPHIVLNVKDGTQVYWGAAWGQAARYLEQTEKDKLADLYQFFIDNNHTLQGRAKYIELRQL